MFPALTRLLSQVVLTRFGSVLTKNTVLKQDHFPGCQNNALPLVQGAPNFRQVPSLPVYGVAIPTVGGLRRILNTLGANKGTVHCPLQAIHYLSVSSNSCRESAVLELMTSIPNSQIFQLSSVGVFFSARTARAMAQHARGARAVHQRPALCAAGG